MPYNKTELLCLPLDERKQIASDLIDSILTDEMKPVPEWKKELIREELNTIMNMQAMVLSGKN